FDELFRQATQEIKTFADDLEQQGGTVLGSVDGVDVTVEHVKAMDENSLLQLDYGDALDKFRRVSKLKQTIEEQAPGKLKGKKGPPAPTPNPAAKSSNNISLIRPLINLKAMRKAVTPQHLAAEETKLLKVEESVRIFVRVADPKFRQVVPMRFFNLTLT